MAQDNQIRSTIIVNVGLVFGISVAALGFAHAKVFIPTEGNPTITESQSAELTKANTKAGKMVLLGTMIAITPLLLKWKNII